ncbi:MAG: chemotaxis protein CheC, partial [Gammaproteobacteria bacterium]|nr:chemotaxis protein CheC [Gammaproteobacteria bacterium]
MSDQIISEDYRDTLSELFNIGMGKAANSLSEMLSDEIILTVPQLECMSYEEAMVLYLNAGNDNI